MKLQKNQIFDCKIFLFKSKIGIKNKNQKEWIKEKTEEHRPEYIGFHNKYENHILSSGNTKAEVWKTSGKNRIRTQVASAFYFLLFLRAFAMALFSLKKSVSIEPHSCSRIPPSKVG